MQIFARRAISAQPVSITQDFPFGQGVIFDDNSPTTLRQQSFRNRGRYRIRVSCYVVQAAGRPAWLKIYATNFKVRRLLGYFDLPAEGKREVELTV